MPEKIHMPTQRVINILELLAMHPEGLTLTQIANGINSPKSTVLPIVRTLRSNKYAFYNPQSALYWVGVAAFSTGSAYISQMNSLKFIRSEMKYIVQQCGEICHLGIRDGNKAVFISIEESNAAIQLVSRVGKRMPLHCSAIGKSLICTMDIDEIRALHPKGLEAFTEKTITRFDLLEKELESIRNNGYVSIEIGEMGPDLACVSVPLFKYDSIIAAVSVSIPILRTTDDKLDQISVLLQEMQLKVKTYLEINNVDPESLAFFG